MTKAQHAPHPRYPWKTLCGRPNPAWPYDQEILPEANPTCLTCRRLWRRLTPNQQKRAQP